MKRKMRNQLARTEEGGGREGGEGEEKSAAGEEGGEGAKKNKNKDKKISRFYSLKSFDSDPCRS